MHRESMNQAQNFATIQQAQMSALLAQGQLQNQLSSDKGSRLPRCRTRTPKAENYRADAHDDWPAEPFGVRSAYLCAEWRSRLPMGASPSRRIGHQRRFRPR